MRYKCIVSYDGYNYNGFQVQPNGITIEEEINKAFYKMLNEDVKIHASGRTDSRVHALGQVFHFDTSHEISCDSFKYALNRFLPNDIRVVDVEGVSDDFHARFSAKGKEYHYLIKTKPLSVFESRYMIYVDNLDVNLMNEGLKRLIGYHNFKGFCSSRVNKLKDFNKTIYEAYIETDGDILRFVFKGSGFLKYQIRRMMGLIVEIGLKREKVSKIDEVLEKCDPTISHKICDGEGLYLVKVYYD